MRQGYPLLCGDDTATGFQPRDKEQSGINRSCSVIEWAVDKMEGYLHISYV